MVFDHNIVSILFQELLCLIPAKNMNCDPPEKPAKPGTVVNLHGIVLHETTGGEYFLR